NTVGHRVDMGEVEHPGVSTRVHGFRKNQAVKFAVVAGSANDDARFVRLAVGSAGDEELICNVREMLEIIGGLQLHQRLIELSRARDLRRSGSRRRHNQWSRWCRRRTSLSTLTASSLSRRSTLRTVVLARNGNRQLPENR